MLILAQMVLQICNSEAVGFGIFDRILTFDNRQPEVVSDVISGTTVKLSELESYICKMEVRGGFQQQFEG